MGITTAPSLPACRVQELWRCDYFHMYFDGWRQRAVVSHGHHRESPLVQCPVELWEWGCLHYPRLVEPHVRSSSLGESPALNSDPGELQNVLCRPSHGSRATQSLGDRTTTPVCLEGRIPNQTGLKIWDLLSTSTAFYFPISSFWNGSVCSIPVPYLYFGST